MSDDAQAMPEPPPDERFLLSAQLFAAQADAKDWMVKYSIERDERVKAEEALERVSAQLRMVTLDRARLIEQNDRLTTGLVLALELAKNRCD